ncbi:HAMP domain-containing histidine kinase [Burkholderiaceae bacterium FT117]|uniref:sensor histidine kinase n=1 Tax=Zeimonas sediminis TaxID=2944268 RepID=UPI002342F744|nr:HAMP domain-containing sensor histidine kinase [Zeimonas sediminis]MCM5569327.1 HAMP domain-containing histidine kinase [Zeimonas sediminis]
MATGSRPTDAAPGPAATREGGAAATRRPPSLRRRLGTAFAGLALLIALAQASFVWIIGYHAEEQLIDRILAEQLDRSIALYRQQPALAAPNTPDMSLYVLPDGDASAEAVLPAWLRALPRRAGTYELHPGEGLEYHVAIARDRDAWFLLAYDAAEHEARQHDELAALALSVLAIGVLALLLSGRMAGKLTRDLQGLSEAVSEPGSHAGARARLGAIAAHAETAMLADALDAYRDGLREALERERAFTAAANHELRTPLMRAGSSLDLLRTGALDARQRRLVDNVQASLDEMTMLTAALLRVARGQSAEAATDTDVGQLLAEVVAQLAAEAQARGIALSADPAAAPRLRLDRSALWIVLANLVRNAIRHSGGTRVRVGWREGEVFVEDDGVGIDREAFTPQRPRAAEAHGLGLGLAIVERICDAAGWRLAIEPRPGGGTLARVRVAGG